MFVHELSSAMYGSKGAGGTGSYMYMVAALTHARSIVLGGKAKDSKKKRTFSFANLDHTSDSSASTNVLLKGRQGYP